MSDALITSEGFCDALLPAMLADLGAACARVGGTVQLYVKGDDVDTARIVTLDKVSTIEPGEDPDADVILAVDERALTDLLAGTLDVDKALADGLVEVDGDVTVLARFAELLSGGTNPLAARLAAMTAPR